MFRHYWNFYPACFTYYHSTILSSWFMPIFLDTRLELFCACIFDLVDRLTHSTWELGYSSEHSDIGLYPQLTTANCTARSSFSSISPRLDARCALPPLLQTKPVQKLCLSCHGPWRTSDAPLVPQPSSERHRSCFTQSQAKNWAVVMFRPQPPAYSGTPSSETQ
jgi:hypothetical protein